MEHQLTFRQTHPKRPEGMLECETCGVQFDVPSEEEGQDLIRFLRQVGTGGACGLNVVKEVLDV